MLGIEAPPLPHIEQLWAEEGPTLLEGRLAEAYGLTLAFTRRDDRPTIVANFVSTLDGVVSYATPEAAGGGEISGFFGPDRFVMSLLRGLADAVLIGAGTLRAGASDAWTPDFIYPAAGTEIGDLRRLLGLTPQPTTVVVSASGQVDLGHPGLTAPDVPSLVVTTKHGAEHIGSDGVRFEVAVAGDEAVAAERLISELARRGLGIVLCEGGPHLLASLLEVDLVDELFLTMAPQIAGRTHRNPRLALAEGIAFSVADAPWWRLVSLARSGDHLFLRYRRDRGTHPDREVRA